MDVGDFLRNLGLQQYESTARDDGINARVFPKLTAEDLKDLRITAIGNRRLSVFHDCQTEGGKRQAAQRKLAGMPGATKLGTGELRNLS
jgi:hypothetical protein